MAQNTPRPTATASDEPVSPLRLRFYEDTYDDAGNALGWRPTADALLMADGSVAVIPADSRGCREAAMWDDLDAARDAHGGYLDTVQPRRTLVLDDLDLVPFVRRLVDAHSAERGCD